MNEVRTTFLDAVRTARSVLAAQEVAKRWDRPSALREMTVGALAGHLSRAITAVGAYLQNPTKSKEPVSPGEYYAAVLTTSDISDPIHVGIRERAKQEGQRGHGALVSRWDDALDSLGEKLASEPEDRVLTVMSDLVLMLDDYPVTRLVEVVVHTDDLAISTGLDTPRFAPRTMELIFAHLVDVARVRHGDLAVLRAFSRRERDAVDALRIF